MPDVSSTAPADATTWVALDVHKHSIVAAILPATGAKPELVEIQNTERAIRGLLKRLGGAEGRAVFYEAGPCGYDLLRLLAGLGVSCNVVAPALVPVQPGARVKTDRRDAKKLVTLFRAGALKFVARPSLAQEGLRDLVGAREDLRQARTAARHRVAKTLLRYGHVFRAGMMGFLGLTPTEYSSGESRHRGHITKAGNEHARRLLVEAAWHYRHAPRASARASAQHPFVPPAVPARAWVAQVCLHGRHRHLTAHGKRSTVANVAVARELAGFLCAAMTSQALREEVAA